MEKHKEPHHPATRPGSTSYRTCSQGQNKPSRTDLPTPALKPGPSPTQTPCSNGHAMLLLFYLHFRFEMKICVSGSYYPSHSATAQLPSGAA